MKKLTSLVLAAAMVLALGAITFAETITTGDQNIDVEAKYQDRTTTATVYSVDITWGAMQFTYAENGTMTWNPSDHTYSGSTTAGWTATGNTVTVVNHSNADITASFAFEALETYSEVTGTFDIESKALAAGVVNGYDAADEVTVRLTLGGTLPETVTNYTKIGKITVTIE